MVRSEKGVLADDAAAEILRSRPELTVMIDPMHRAQDVDMIGVRGAVLLHEAE